MRKVHAARSARRTIMSSVLAAAMGLLRIGGAQAADDALVKAAQREGQVVWYTTMLVDQAVRPLAVAFKAKYGITLEYARSNSAEVALKIINEGQAGRRLGDVFDGAGAYTSARAAGMVAPYTPASATGLPETSKDPQGYWYAVNYYFLTAAVNTELLSLEEAPKTYDDLLDPKWKEQMVWSVVPEPTGAAGFVGGILLTRGEAAGMTYLEQLAKQKITNMATSQRAVLDRVILGDFPIALMVFNHHVPISQAKGARVEWVRMEPVVSSAGLIALAKDAPHPNAAKLFIDFILSEQGQKIIAEAGYLPSNPNVPALDPSLQPNGPKPFAFNFLNPELVGKDLARWIEIADRLFKSNR